MTEDQTDIDDVTRRPNARVVNPDGSIAWELVDGERDQEQPYGVTD